MRLQRKAAPKPAVHIMFRVFGQPRRLLNAQCAFLAVLDDATRATSRLTQHAAKGFRKGMSVAWPPRRNIVAIAHHKSRPCVTEGIALQAGCLPAVIRISLRNIHEIICTCERARDFLLHRHKAIRLSVLLQIGPIVVWIPKPRDASDSPRTALERPGQRGRLVFRSVTPGPIYST